MVLRSKVQLFSQETKYLVRKVWVSESHYFLTRDNHGVGSTDHFSVSQ
jgi:hypothetical protein